MICLIRGTCISHNHADMVAAAMASTLMQKFNKRVLVLQTDSSHPIENVMLGARKSSQKMTSDKFSFTDDGMEALARRIEIGPISREQFTDCCLNISKTANSLDIACVSDKVVWTEEHLSRLLTSAAMIYDVVLITADVPEIEKLEPHVDKEIVCVKQGIKEAYSAREDAAIAVVNYDTVSSFNLKAMAKIYGKKTVYGIPYNTGFNDACMKNYAIAFLFSNNAPESHDDNYLFCKGVSQLVEGILGLDDVEVKERDFVYLSSAVRKARSMKQ